MKNWFSGQLKSFCFDLICLSSQLRVPDKADKLAANFAIAAISAYQFCLSPFIGGDCIFYPTCSRRAAALLRVHGWNNGLPLVRRQIDDCGGNYLLSVPVGGEVELVTSSGRIFRTHALAPLMRAKMATITDLDGLVRK